MHKHPRTIDIVVGVQGAGKTTLIKELVFDYDRVIVCDHRDEYDIGTPYADFETMAHDASRLRRFLFVWKGDPSYVNAIFHLAFAIGPTKGSPESETGVCVVMSEAENYPLSENEHIRTAVLTGRKPARISIIADCQRPQMLEPDYRSQVTGVWAFFNAEISAIQWLRTYFGAEAPSISQLEPLKGKLWQWGAGPVRDFAVHP